MPRELLYSETQIESDIVRETCERVYDEETAEKREGAVEDMIRAYRLGWYRADRYGIDGGKNKAEHIDNPIGDTWRSDAECAAMSDRVG